MSGDWWKKSEWSYISACISQGSILGPLLFLINANDIIGIDNEILLFVDDICLLEPVQNPKTGITKCDNDLAKLSSWAKKWLANFNPTKTKFLAFSNKLNKTNHDPLYLDSEIVGRVQSHCQLGITLNEKVTWDNRIRE